jgi:hypothetical protein
MQTMTKTVSALLIGAAAIAFTAPAQAQVGVEVGVPGVGVRVGDPDRVDRERRERAREEVIIRDRRDSNTGACSTRPVQKERPDGSVVTQQDRVCD